jgi:hypothetical protein
MQRADAVTTRDRAVLGVRISTVAAVVGALGLAWLFGELGYEYFSGNPPAPPKVPQVPNQPAPVQAAPPVVVKVVHHQGLAPTGGSAPRPPSSAPGAAPPAPPPPACHSTPSKPC